MLSHRECGLLMLKGDSDITTPGIEDINNKPPNTPHLSTGSKKQNLLPLTSYVQQKKNELTTISKENELQNVK